MYRILFAGTPEFAVPSLQALIDDPRFEVIGVFTQPDRPAGRGQKLQASPVKQLALKYNLPVLQPLTLKDPEAQQTLAQLQPDVMIVAAYGLILPQVVLDIPKYGCINIHGSLLPHWRGAAPVQRAIEAGDQQTGITIMQMEKGLDTGGMFYVKTCTIHPEDTGASLMQKLSHLGAEALTESLEKILLGELTAIPQDSLQATYAKKMEKIEGLLDWEQTAETLERRIRAFYPWPGCYFIHNAQTIKVGQARVIQTCSAVPGTVMEVDSAGIIIACAKNALCLTHIQLPGGKMLPVSHCLSSQPLKELFINRH